MLSLFYDLSTALYKKSNHIMIAFIAYSAAIPQQQPSDNTATALSSLKYVLV